MLAAILAASTFLHAESNGGNASAYGQGSSSMDSIEIGLLTCSPHNEVYSLYGHSALHWHNLKTGEHWVFNYGVFDYKKPHFVWRFIMGKTDYRLECTRHFNDGEHSFCDYYRKWGSSVEEQILDLTPSEKTKLIIALEEKLRDPVYRYNFFFDNCSTRPRDIIEKCLDGILTYDTSLDNQLTFRQMLHRQTADHPWATFGNDLLLGVTADRRATQREQQFLPANLRRDIDHATVERQGAKRPLVKKHVTHVPLGAQPEESGMLPSPLACTLLLLLLSIGLFCYEQKKKKTLVSWDVLLMLLTGLPGCLLLLMLFSEHPATSTNLQILLANPLALLFIPAVAKRKHTRWFTISLIFTVLFLIGGIWQDYAEGMECVALCLLLRYWRHRNDK